MEKEKIKKIIKFAIDCAEDETEYKNEIVSSIISGLIMRDVSDNTPNNQIQKSSPSLKDRKIVPVREFVLQKNPSGDIERTLTFGYYLENFSGFTSFGTGDIIKCFLESKFPVPQNPSDKIQKCIAAGWIMETKEDLKGNVKKYTLTNTGVDTIDKNFGRDSS